MKGKQSHHVCFYKPVSEEEKKDRLHHLVTYPQPQSDSGIFSQIPLQVSPQEAARCAERKVGTLGLVAQSLASLSPIHTESVCTHYQDS